MLEKFSARTRHIIILIFGALTTTGSIEIFNISPAWASMIGVIGTALGLNVTPLTRQYGAGKD